jgi:xanthine dehydrogenase/oxidase
MGKFYDANRLQIFYSQVHAVNTENYLDDKDLFDVTTLQTALRILDTEVKPIQVLPDASAVFRKKLASALFYKVLQEATI